MFNFIKSRFGTVRSVNETQRQRIERALSEVNEVLAAMAEKPKVTMDMASGEITVDLPDQMPDEALALPAPEETPQDPAEDDKVDEAA